MTTSDAGTAETRVRGRRGQGQVGEPAALVMAALVVGGAALLGCGDNHVTQLEAILQDGELTVLTRHGLTAAPKAKPAAATTPAGTGGMGGAPSTLGTGGIFPDEAKGRWRFDDCTPLRTDLADSNQSAHVAFRSVSVACGEGAGKGGVVIDGADDYVYVPDQPDYTFERGVTAAAWVKPTRLGDVRTIFRKREGGTSTFVLLTNGRDYQFVVRLTSGRAVEVSARARANVWTHVAGTYDGSELRLYLDGTLAARARVTGQLSSGAGPLLMGNDANGRRLDGALDDVFFDTAAITQEQVALLTCIPQPATVVAVPVSGPVVPAGSTVAYDLQVTNHDSRFCAAKSFGLQSFTNIVGLVSEPRFGSIPELAPGGTAHVEFTVTSAPELEPDTYPAPFTVFANAEPFDAVVGQVTYTVQGTACSVRTRKELMIRDISVVDDPVRTTGSGAWTFARLMQNLAPSAAAAPEMVEAMLSTWLVDQTVNGQVIPARPAMTDLVLSSFPRTADGRLDLARAPVRLLAIVNRMDVRNVAQGHAGEGRFVFGVLDAGGNQTQFTIIFEYRLPATTAQEVVDWANRWHALADLPMPSEQYNAALQAITDRFTGRDAEPARINGSALTEVRTNEIALSFEWEFRSFQLSPTTRTLVPAPLALTPGRDFNGTETLTSYVAENEAAILAETHTVPPEFAGQRFQAGSVTNDLNGWDVPGSNPEARQKFSINTCNGCHSTRETQTFFLQVAPRERGQEAFLSPFLTGGRVFDFEAGVIRQFNDLGRRNRDLRLLLCPGDVVPLPALGLGATVAGGDGGRAGATRRTAGPASVGTGAAARSDAASAPPGTPVVEESTVDATRADFVTKGIDRTD